MKELIKTLLRLDLMEVPQDYEMMLFGMWSRWCEDFSTTQLEYQKLISNPALNAWYLTELAKLEIKFVQECKKSPKTSGELTRELYNEITYEMFSIRPNILIKEAKKTQNIGYMSLHGMRVETKIFNQN